MTTSSDDAARVRITVPCEDLAALNKLHPSTTLTALVQQLIKQELANQSR